MNKIGRNDPCTCGSGKKYKKCCEMQTTTTKKFRAEVIPSVPQASNLGMNKVASLFFRNAVPVAEKSGESSEVVTQTAQDS